MVGMHYEWQPQALEVNLIWFDGNTPAGGDNHHRAQSVDLSSVSRVTQSNCRPHESPSNDVSSRSELLKRRSVFDKFSCVEFRAWMRASLPGSFHSSEVNKVFLAHRLMAMSQQWWIRWVARADNWRWIRIRHGRFERVSFGEQWIFLFVFPYRGEGGETGGSFSSMILVFRSTRPSYFDIWSHRLKYHLHNKSQWNERNAIRIENAMTFVFR